MSRLALCLPLPFVVILPACTGGIHRQGNHQISVTSSYDYPITGNVIWPDGEGRAQNVGGTVGYNYFFEDRWAFMAAGTPVRIYATPDQYTYAGELQIGFRYYPWEFTLGQTPVALYAEVLGGMLQASRQLPPGGSHTNFTQDTGVGVEVKLTDEVSWLVGYRLRHLSNGYIFAADNPSQNDQQIYTGFAITLK